MIGQKLENVENRRYREYLYTPDQSMTLNGCCESYPLDRDYWNNQLLDRNFLIDYGTVEHLKYPISEGVCMGDASVPRTCLPPSKKINPVWTIEEEGLLDGISCQEQRMERQACYWLQNDSRVTCPPRKSTSDLPISSISPITTLDSSQGLPLIPESQSNIGQRLINPETGALDINCSLNLLEKKRLENQCCPLQGISDSVMKRRWTPRAKQDLIFGQKAHRGWIAGQKARDYVALMNNPGSTGNRRNVDAESALKGVNYLNNADCYENKICSDPLQGNKPDLFGEFFQDNNCIYPNFTPKFWDNMTRARSGAKLVTAKGYSKNALC